MLCRRQWYDVQAVRAAAAAWRLSCLSSEFIQSHSRDGDTRRQRAHDASAHVCTIRRD